MIIHSDWFLYVGTGGIATFILLSGLASLLGLSSSLIPPQENALWYIIFGSILYVGLYIHWSMMRKMK